MLYSRKTLNDDGSDDKIMMVTIRIATDCSLLLLDNWCFEPSKPQRIISGLKKDQFIPNHMPASHKTTYDFLLQLSVKIFRTKITATHFFFFFLKYTSFSQKGKHFLQVSISK